MNEFFRVSDQVIPPKYATDGSSCFDICAYLPAEKHVQFKMSSNINFFRMVMNSHTVISPGERALIPTGLHFNIHSGYELKLYSRSGIPWKHNITVHNGVGVIDSDYINELFVMLQNHGSKTFIINHGDRIAQAQFVKILRKPLKETVIKPTQKTSRIGGFGSTGVNKL